MGDCKKFWKGFLYLFATGEMRYLLGSRSRRAVLAALVSGKRSLSSLEEMTGLPYGTVKREASLLREKRVLAADGEQLYLDRTDSRVAALMALLSGQ